MEIIFVQEGIFKNHTAILKQNFIGVELHGTAIIYGLDKIRTFQKKEFESYSQEWQETMLVKAVSHGIAKNLSKEAIYQYMQGNPNQEKMKEVAQTTFNLLPIQFFQSHKAVRALHDALSNALVEDLKEYQYKPTFQAHQQKHNIMELWGLNAVCHNVLNELAEKENLPLPKEKDRG